MKNTVPENRRQKILLLQVVIIACKADGVISTEESQTINAILSGLSLHMDDLDDIDRCWKGERDISLLAEDIKEEGIEETAFKEAVAILLLEGMNHREHEFLMSFAGFLNISDERCAEIVEEVRSELDQPVSFVVDEGDTSSGNRGELSRSPSAEENDALILKYAVWGGAVGLSPLPFVGDFFILAPLQMKMVHDIARSHGYDLDQQSIQEFSAVLGVSFGLKLFSSAVRKFVPVVGSVASALVSFSGTYAIGKTADTYFRRGRSVEDDELRKIYEKFKNDGEGLYATVEKKIKSVDLDKITEKFRKKK